MAVGRVVAVATKEAIQQLAARRDELSNAAPPSERVSKALEIRSVPTGVYLYTSEDRASSCSRGRSSRGGANRMTNLPTRRTLPPSSGTAIRLCRAAKAGADYRSQRLWERRPC